MLIFYCLQAGIVCASSCLVTPKNKYKKSIDSVRGSDILSLVMLAEALRIRLCG
jgi:hypothetical protein